MALNLGDVAIQFKADLSPLDQAASKLKKLEGTSVRVNAKTSRGFTRTKRAADSVKKSTSGLASALDNAAKAAQLTEGPLSGIASRLVTLKGILNSNTAALAAFSVGLGSIVSSSIAATKVFLEAEEGIVRLGTALIRTGRSEVATFKQLNDVSAGLAKRTLLDLNEVRNGLATAATFSNLPTSELKRFADVAADAAAVTGRDFRNTIIQFGKAIQNPASALDGLNRLGIAFTKEQKKMLQALAETGQGAQVTEIILSKLESTFAGLGTAAGSSGALDSLQASIQLFRESIFLNSKAGDSLANLFNTLNQVISGFTGELGLSARFGRVLAGVFDALSNSLRFLERNAETVKEIFQILSGALILKTASVWLKLVGAIKLSAGTLIAFAAAAKRFLPLAIFAGLVKLVDHFIVVENKVSGLRKTFELFRAVFVVTVRRLKEAWELFSNSFNVALESNSKNLSILKSNLGTVANSFLEFANSAVDPLKIIPIAFIEVTISVQEAFKDLFLFLTDGVTDLGNLFKSLANKDFKGARDALADFFTVPRTDLNDSLLATEGLLTRIRKNFRDSKDFDFRDLGSDTAGLFGDLLTAIDTTSVVKVAKELGQSFGEEVKTEMMDSLSKPASGTGASNPLAGVVGQLSNQKPLFEDLGESLGSSLIDGIVKAVDTLGGAVSKKIGDRIVGRDTTSFREIAKDFVSSLFSTFIQELAINPLVEQFKVLINSTSKGGAGGGMGGIFGLLSKFIPGGGTAGAAEAVTAGAAGAGNTIFGLSNGGRPSLNRTSLVGENGPELFVPQQRGTIIPNSMMPQMGSSEQRPVVVNINGVSDFQSFELARNRVQSDIQRTIRNT